MIKFKDFLVSGQKEQLRPSLATDSWDAQDRQRNALFACGFNIS
jgi:hypothetical protein